MPTGIIKWYDSKNSEFAIVEESDNNNLIILDTSQLDIPKGHLKPGDMISYEIKLNPFAPVAKEICKI